MKWWHTYFMKTEHCISCNSDKIYCKNLCRKCYRNQFVPTRWSKNYDKCVTCRGSGYPHVARGQCQMCYSHRFSNVLCACGCGNFTTLRGNKPKELIQGHWLKLRGNSDSIRPDISGENNPQFGKFGAEHPSFGHETSQKTREERRNRRLKFLSERGKITGIESILSNLLDEMKIFHIPQKTMYGKFSVDEFLPEYNLIIEAYGGYWHGDSRRFPNLSKQQLKTKSKDRSKEKYLVACGHRLLVLWEDELLKCQTWCKSEIELAILKYLIPLVQDSIKRET